MNTRARELYFVVPGDINTLTGGYRYDKRITDGLTALGWQVFILSLPGSYPFPSAEALEAAAAQFTALPNGALVVVDGLAFGVLSEPVRAHASRLTVIALVHHPLALETGLSAEQAAAFKHHETQALALASHVITTSRFTAESLKQYHVHPQAVSVVCPGTDPAPLAVGSQTNSVNLLCVATLTRRKAHSGLLDALKPLEHKRWHLNCVGSTERDADTYQALLQQREKLHLDKRVSFLGELSESALSRQYHQADVFLLNSSHEGFGMVLTEAIARGLPVIATDAGASGHTVPTGAGILVPPGDTHALSEAVAQFLNNGDLRQQLEQAAIAARDDLPDWDAATRQFHTQLLTLSTV